jgi:hypothetical protein
LGHICDEKRLTWLAKREQWINMRRLVTPTYYFRNREAGNMGRSRESFEGAGGELQMKAPAHFL